MFQSQQYNRLREIYMEFILCLTGADSVYPDYAMAVLKEVKRGEPVALSSQEFFNKIVRKNDNNLDKGILRYTISRMAGSVMFEKKGEGYYATIQCPLEFVHSKCVETMKIDINLLTKEANMETSSLEEELEPEVKEDDLDSEEKIIVRETALLKMEKAIGFSYDFVVDNVFYPCFNLFCSDEDDKDWEYLESVGLACWKHVNHEYRSSYSLTKKGFDFISAVTGVIIKTDGVKI